MILEKLKIRFSPLDKRQQNLLKRIKNYKLADTAYEQYTHNIRNNENDSKDLARSKLIRNIILGKEIHSICSLIFYRYGNLEIHIDTTLKIIYWIKNRTGKYHFDYNIEQSEKKEWLENFLKIKEKK